MGVRVGGGGGRKEGGKRKTTEELYFSKEKLPHLSPLDFSIILLEIATREEREERPSSCELDFLNPCSQSSSNKHSPQ